MHPPAPHRSGKVEHTSDGRAELVVGLAHCASVPDRTARAPHLQRFLDPETAADSVVVVKSQSVLLRRILAVNAIIAFMFALPTTTLASGLADAEVSAQVTPLEEDPEDAPGLGSITGSPDPGPKPDDAGERGGWAQLALAVVMLSALSFIGFQVFRQSQRNRPHNVTDRGQL